MSRQQIIEDILAQARAEAESIRSESRASLEQREKSLNEREARILEEAEKRVADQDREIRNRFDRQAEREIRRLKLELQDRTVRTVTSRTKNAVESLRETPEYPKLLEEWTVEALVGLGLEPGEPAVLRCAPADRDTLKRIVEHIPDHPALTIDERPLPSGTTGVVALDSEGRRAFSNTVDDRIRRAARDIHRIVITEVFTESSL